MRLPRSKQQRALELTISLATYGSLLYPLLKIPFRSCLIRQWKQVCFQTHGKLLGLLLFTKMEIGLISQTIAPHQSYQSFQGSSKTCNQSCVPAYGR